MFGNTANSFGSTFASQPTPQQNGFNPSTSTMFGQNQNNTASTPSFGGFGQSKPEQPQQNGLTPSTNSSFPSFGQQNGDSTFKFGQSQNQTQSTAQTSFGGFGQNSQHNAEKAKTPSFGSFGQSQPNGDKSLLGATSQSQPEQTPDTTTGSIFSKFNHQSQQNGSKPLFGVTPSASQTDDTPKATSTSNLFTSGQQNGGAKTLFGASPPPEQQTTKTPNLGGSVLTGLDPARASTIKAGMFGTSSKKDETPKAPNADLFNLGGHSVGEGDQNTPKASNNMFQSQQSNGVKPGMFGGEQQTPKPNASANLFTGAFGQQQNSTSAFTFGQSQQDTSMTTPGNTPQKQSTASTSDQSTANAQSKSLFDRISKDPPATAQKPAFTPSSTSMFGAPAASTTTANDENNAPSGQGGGLFDRITPRDPPATAQNPSSTPSTSSLFSKPAADRPAAPPAASAAPWISGTPASQATTSRAPKTTTTTMNETIPESEHETFKVLNEGLRGHLTKQDPSLDWSTVFRYYIQQAAKIRGKPEPKLDDAPAQARARAPPAAPSSSAAAPTTASAKPPPPWGNGKSSSQRDSTPRAPAATPTASTSNLFNGVTSRAFAPSANFVSASSQQQQTPKPSLLKPPSTAPPGASKKRIFEEDDDDEEQRPPATEKRRKPDDDTRVEYPKLPENASETAKLFQAALDKPGRGKEGEKVQRQEQVPPAFQPPPSSGFQPPTSSTAPPTGMPTFSAPSGGFLAAFGKKANQEEEKQRRKRKMEDYDSDEETEEVWAARDAEEQERKRVKILEEAKKSGGFVISRSESRSGTPAGGDEDEDEDDEGEKEVDAGKSLFDRITPRDPSAQTPSQEKPTSNLFGNMSKTTSSAFGGGSSTTSNLFGNLSKTSEGTEKDKTDVEKEQGSGDNTWKPNTPIKFGDISGTESTTPAAPPPSENKHLFSNLFGSKPSSSTDSTGHLSVPGAKPAIGFNFGGQPASLGTSRATTPGITTDGEGASTAGEGDNDDEHQQQEEKQEEKQVEDSTGLRPSELEHEDLLFSVPVCKAMKTDDKKNPDTGEMEQGWVDKGKGPLYILTHKDTGNVRVILKVSPFGRAVMNFGVVAGAKYEVVGTGKYVQAFFVDHINVREGQRPKIGMWLLQVKDPEDAKDMARVMMEASGDGA